MRVGIEEALARTGYDFMSARDGSRALALCQAKNPDVVIIDFALPGIDGLSVTRKLRSAGADQPILMLDSGDDVQHRVGALDAGADDVLTKPFNVDELLARLRAMLRRRGTSPELWVSGISLNMGARSVSVGGHKLKLTTIEFDLLALFMQNPDQVLGRETLQLAGWGRELPETSKSLEVHISTLRAKLESGNDARVLDTVRGLGYILRQR